jgi:hypothetical protein
MSAPPPLSVSHPVRVSALEPEKTWKLDADTLWIHVEGQQDMPLPLASISKLRLSFDPGRAQRNLFRCHLYHAGGRCAVIQNVHYQGFASFGDRTDTYLPFVRALVSRLASVNPRCEFVAGTSHLRWWANAAFLAVAFGFLAIVLVLLYSAVGPLALFKLLIIAFFIPTTIRWFTKNWPKKFSPHAIPENLLPKG